MSFEGGRALEAVARRVANLETLDAIALTGDLMPDFKTQPEQIENWLSAALGGAMVEVLELDLETAYLFKIHDRGRPPYPSLVVSWEALEDWTAQQIFADFEQNGLATSLRENPDQRFVYRTSRKIFVQDQ